jgi:hypothetical protein
MNVMNVARSHDLSPVTQTVFCYGFMEGEAMPEEEGMFHR